MKDSQPLQPPIRAVPPPQLDTADAPQPWLTWRKSQMPWLSRFTYSWILAICLLLLVAGWRITPDLRGHSSHEQLGLAPCGFYITSGYPCPTCGATTAFAWFVHGHPWMALKTHPFGAASVVLAVTLLGISLVGIVTARVPAIRLSRRSSVALATAFLALFLGSWLYKILIMANAH